jgi:hypothetical protein
LALKNLEDSEDLKKEKQREGAEEAPLYCKQKTHYWRQGKTTQGEVLIDLN